MSCTVLRAFLGSNMSGVRCVTKSSNLWSNRRITPMNLIKKLICWARFIFKFVFSGKILSRCEQLNQASTLYVLHYRKHIILLDHIMTLAGPKICSCCYFFWPGSKIWYCEAHLSRSVLNICRPPDSTWNLDDIICHIMLQYVGWSSLVGFGRFFSLHRNWWRARFMAGGRN